MIHFRLFGDFRLVYDDVPIADINQPRLRSLLTYLALHRHAPQSRQRLAFLLWPDSSEAQAHTNLRKQLMRLRRVLPAADHFLLVDNLTVQWNPESLFWLDVAEFEALLAQAKNTEQRANQATTLNSLQQAIKLYQGDLLPNCYEDWLIPERERLRQAFIQALEQLAYLLECQRRYLEAIHYTQQLQRYDPLYEETYRQLMRLHSLNGNRAGALHLYHEFVTQLRNELGVEPSQATQEVYQRLLKLEPSDGLPPGSVRTTTTDASLVGRKEEWVRLQETWHRAVSGTPIFTFITGEAGIGKTRLAEELLEWANHQGIPTAVAHCYAAEGTLAYAPVVAWLRSQPIREHLSSLDTVWLTELARLLPELLAEHPTLRPLDPWTDSWQRQRLFEALAHAILVNRQPTLLLIDDLQWCDQDTLEWLHYLLRFDKQAQLLVLSTIRTEEADKPSLAMLRLQLRQSEKAVELALEPLAQDETAVLASHVLGQQLTQEQAERLYAETEGNPLFVLETIRAGIQAGPDPGNLNFRHLPPKVQAVIEARLGQLTDAARELIGLAATIGRAFNFEVLSRASNHDEDTLVLSLDELWRRRLIREQSHNSYDFSHDRIREVAYNSLSTTRRRWLHRQVAGALEAIHASNLNEISGQIARHYEHGGVP